jgi:hypothetical protein
MGTNTTAKLVAVLSISSAEIYIENDAGKVSSVEIVDADGIKQIGVLAAVFVTSGRCPHYPRKRTFTGATAMSALCQKQTSRAKRRSPLGLVPLVSFAEPEHGRTIPLADYRAILRHACGYKLASDGHDTRSLQVYLGHRNIQNTTHYTALAPDRFKSFWRD